jgi:cyclopropane fatty-acyl-phospholipid synthase-like methyltransferase
MELPFSQACENNKAPILAVLQRHFSRPGRVLEIAGGTGQHAEYFAAAMPWLHWVSTDVPANVATLNLRLAAAALANLPPAQPLDVTQADWGQRDIHYLFSANSLHIMPQSAVVDFFRPLREVLTPGAVVCVYGPFKYGGEFTTPSNAAFDLWLKERSPASGIRDVETIQALAVAAGLTLVEDNAMPANNQLLVWRRDEDA